MDTSEINDFSKQQSSPANNHDELMPASSQDIQWGCPGNELATLSCQQASDLLRQGQPLANCQVEELDLVGIEFAQAVLIRHCRIGRLDLSATNCRQGLTIAESSIGTLVLSNHDRQKKPRQTIIAATTVFDRLEITGTFIGEEVVFTGPFTCRSRFHGPALFNASRFENDAIFNYSIFQGDWECNRCSFEGKAWLGSMTVVGAASFRRSQFKRKMNAKYSNFHGKVFFTDVVFNARAGFNVVVVEEALEFDRSRFANELSCRGSQLRDLSLRFTEIAADLCFDNSIFKRRFALNHLQLQGKLSAGHTQFQGKAEFDGARLAGHVAFVKAQFSGPFFCRQAQLGNADASIDFSGAHFVKAVDCDASQFLGNIDFSGAIFQGKASFRKSGFGHSEARVQFVHTVFHRRTAFKRSRFLGRSDFGHSEFHQRVGFERALFQNPVGFEAVTFSGISSFKESQFARQVFFYDCKLSNAEFTGAEFAGPAYFAVERYIAANGQRPSSFLGEAVFINARFLKQTIFQRVSFAGPARFGNAYFGEQASFHKANFQDQADFNGVFCSLELDLRGTTIAGELMLKGANINRRLNLADADFSNISFYNMVTDTIAVTPDQVRGKFRGDARDCRDSVAKGRTAQEYLILRKSFAGDGMHEEEDWAYSCFRRSSRQASSLQACGSHRVFTLLKNGGERLFLDYGSRYGTHPLRITVVALLFILAFGIFYWHFSSEIILEGKEIMPGQKPTLSQCIYFSIMAFTTMGFGDVHPDFHGWVKGVVALEALLGIMIMTLFVGTYARKIIR